MEISNFFNWSSWWDWYFFILEWVKKFYFMYFLVIYIMLRIRFIKEWQCERRPHKLNIQLQILLEISLFSKKHFKVYCYNKNLVVILIFAGLWLEAHTNILKIVVINVSLLILCRCSQINCVCGVLFLFFPSILSLCVLVYMKCFVAHVTLLSMAYLGDEKETVEIDKLCISDHFA